MKKISLPMEEAGFFWLPDKHNKRVPGILRISESGRVTLEIITQFHFTLPPSPDNPRLDGSDSSFKRILGSTESNHITLENCSVIKPGRLVIKPGLNFRSTPTRKIIQGELALIGVRYDKDEDISFSKIQCFMEGLDAWLSISGFEYDASRSNYFDNRTISYSSPKGITISLPSEDIELKFGFAVSTRTKFATEEKITQNAYAMLKSKTVRSFDDFLLAIRKLRHFLSFAIGREVKLTSMIGYHEDVVQKTGEDGKDVLIPIHVHYEAIQPTENDRLIHPEHMVFSYREMKDRMESMVVNWFKGYGNFRSAFTLYFAFREGKDTYIELQFLCLMSGIMALHRKRKGCQRKKLTEIIRPFQHLYNSEKPQEEGEEPSEKPQEEERPPWEKFVNDSVDTRNELVHPDNKKEINYPELMALSSKLDALFQLHFLKLCGVDESAINDLARKPVLDKKIKDSPDNHRFGSFMGG